MWKGKSTAERLRGLHAKYDPRWENLKTVRIGAQHCSLYSSHQSYWRISNFVSVGVLWFYPPPFNKYRSHTFRSHTRWTELRPRIPSVIHFAKSQESVKSSSVWVHGYDILKDFLLFTARHIISFSLLFIFIEFFLQKPFL